MEGGGLKGKDKDEDKVKIQIKLKRGYYSGGKRAER